MKSLQEFFNETDTKNNVHAYLIEFLEKKAVKMIFERENTDAIADAKDVIDEAFENLEVMFSPKPKKKLINESR